MTVTNHPNVPADIQLDRDPVATDCAVRSWDELYLAVSEDGISLHTSTCHGGDATPIEVYHGRVLHYTVASAYSGSVVIARDTLAEDLREGGQLTALLERVHAGLSVEWNGNNHVGRLTADAEDAAEDMNALLDRDDSRYVDTSWGVWDAEDWLVGDHGITAETTDWQIAALAAEYTAQAVLDHVRFANMFEVLTDIRGRLREEAAEEAAEVEYQQENTNEVFP